MKARQLLSGLLTGVLLLSGCVAGTTAPAGTDYAPAEEDRLTIYTSHKKEVYWPIVKEFEARTGIWVEVITGGTNEILDRIRKEQDSPRADVMFGGGVESLECYRDCFSPYTCRQADQLQPQFRCPDDMWTPFSSLPVVLIYNTKLVKELRSWSDLLDPRFKGRIAFADPSLSGSSFTSLVTMLYALDGERDELLHRFADNLDGYQLDSSGQVLTSVAGGVDWVGITLEETALKRIAAGDDIAIVYPADGTSCVPDASALIKGAPHEDNAKLFLDFTVSQDVQQLLVSQFYRRSVRSDVEPVQELVDLDQIAQVDYNVEWASENRDALLMTWAFYLGGEEET